MSSTKSPFGESQSGYIGPVPTTRIYDVMEIEGTIHKIHRVIVEKFSICFPHDHQHVIDSVNSWINTDDGKWVRDRAIESLEWHTMFDLLSDCSIVSITAKLKDIDYLCYKLKYE